MNSRQLTVTVREIENIDGKKLKYICLTDEWGDKLNINVGNKTFTKASQLCSNERKTINKEKTEANEKPVLQNNMDNNNTKSKPGNR